MEHFLADYFTNGEFMLVENITGSGGWGGKFYAVVCL